MEQLTNSLQGVPVAIAQTKQPVLLGLYTQSYLGTQSVIDTQLRQLYQWAGKGNSVAGMFMDIARILHLVIFRLLTYRK